MDAATGTKRRLAETKPWCYVANSCTDRDYPKGGISTASDPKVLAPYKYCNKVDDTTTNQIAAAPTTTKTSASPTKAAPVSTSTSGVSTPSTAPTQQPDNTNKKFFNSTSGGKYYDKMETRQYANGYTEEYYDGEAYCISALLIPGMSLISRPVLCVFYFLWLIYLFLGIDVISGIFMEAIEVITSKTKVIEVVDKEGKTYSYD